MSSSAFWTNGFKHVFLEETKAKPQNAPKMMRKMLNKSLQKYDKYMTILLDLKWLWNTQHFTAEHIELKNSGAQIGLWIGKYLIFRALIKWQKRRRCQTSLSCTTQVSFICSVHGRRKCAVEPFLFCAVYTFMTINITNLCSVKTLESKRQYKWQKYLIVRKNNG